MAPGHGDGETLEAKGRIVGYARIGQKFTEDKYFRGRPSAVDYNAAGSAGSNKGPSNPDYLSVVQARIDTFIAHNPGIKKEQIPADLVTASGSGLDPHISPAAAFVQVKRIAQTRHLPEAKVEELVRQQIERPFLGIFGPEKVNVLRLNMELDKLK
jgi:K+-transporting ATPase ATPase C chain